MNERYIISMTSHKTRVPYVLTALGDIIYDERFKVVLTLYKDDTKFITEKLQRAIDDKTIELIIADTDYGSHKKYLFTAQRFEEPIITIDDDYYYNVTFLEDLITFWKKYRTSVCARVIQQITFTRYNKLSPLSTWQLTEGIYKPKSMKNMAIGFGGVIYPPGLIDITPEEALNSVSDDILLKAMEIRKGVETVGVISKKGTPIIVKDVTSIAKYPKTDYQSTVNQYKEYFELV